MYATELRAMTMVKKRISVTINQKFLVWIDKRIEELVFANRSHAFEVAIKKLMEERLPQRT